MPTRNAFVRYRVINSYLKSHGSATLDELTAACERALDIRPIGRRTIEGDLWAMRHDSGLGFDAPLVYDRHLRAYRYEREDYSIDGVPLDQEELHALKFAATILKEYKSISYLDEFQGAVQKIIDTIHIHRMQEDYEMDFIELEHAPLVRGSEFIDPLIEHIRTKEVIQIRYHKFVSDKPKEYILHPHLLKEYRGRWFLVALEDQSREFRIFGLERVIRIDPHPDKSYIRKPIDFDSFFRNSIGITRSDREPVNIVVAFTEQQAGYLTTQPLHASQTFLRKVDDRHHFQFTINPTFEFTSMILGWGAEVEVISPEWYRAEIRELVDQVGRLYGGGV